MKLRQAFVGGLTMVAVAWSLHGNWIAAQTPQPPTLTSPGGEFETRASLEAQLRLAESQHRTSEAFLLRTRLEKGDFQEGDRIVVMMHSTAVLQKIETLTVRAGRVFQIPQMDDIKLEGVLRSELNEAVRKYLSKYLQDPEVRTSSLMRVGVLGAVGHQGYYDTSADFLLSDVIMRAGGPTGDANMNGIIIRRGPTVIWGPTETRTALSDGLSLDRLNLRAGDEIFVAPKRHIAWGTIITVTISILTLGVTLIRFR